MYKCPSRKYRTLFECFACGFMESYVAAAVMIAFTAQKSWYTLEASDYPSMHFCLHLVDAAKS